MKIQNKFLVLKRNDIDSALNNFEKVALDTFIDKINSYRKDSGRTPIRKYIVISEKDKELYYKTLELLNEEYNETLNS